MFKLKNKHTDEVITTPYMAEAEEYLNSGDYEISDNKYPYIGKSVFTDFNYVVYGGDCFYSFRNGEFIDDVNEGSLMNITSEYLTNTYGKCESQEHADFICGLAENAGFDVEGFHYEDNWFLFYGNSLAFIINEFSALEDGCKLVNLPLPPKEELMKEVKPIYTKEMYERGELPPVGSFVEKVTHATEFKARSHSDYNRPSAWDKGAKLEVIAHTEICGKMLPVVKCDDMVSSISLSIIKPIQTIEDDLISFLDGYIDANEGAQSYASKFLEKYNITPKYS